MRASAPRSGEAGFTLLEIMIVIGVMAILAGIAIPKLLEGRNSGYEATAIGYLKTLHNAEAGFQSRESRWAPLAELRAKNYMGADPGGYTVILTISADQATYQATATPLIQPTKMRHFFVDTTGVMRYNTGAPADAASTPL